MRKETRYHTLRKLDEDERPADDMTHIYVTGTDSLRDDASGRFRFGFNQLSVAAPLCEDAGGPACLH